MYEVNLFMGTGAALDANQDAYPAGERHALLIFSRQPQGTEPDWAAAEAIVTSKGWCDVQLQEGSLVNPHMLDSDPDARPCYEQALVHGWALIVFSDPVEGVETLIGGEPGRLEDSHA
jgi:hypothetical protein